MTKKGEHVDKIIVIGKIIAIGKIIETEKKGAITENPVIKFGRKNSVDKTIVIGEIDHADVDIMMNIDEKYITTTKSTTKSAGHGEGPLRRSDASTGD